MEDVVIGFDLTHMSATMVEEILIMEDGVNATKQSFNVLLPNDATLQISNIIIIINFLITILSLFYT